MKDKHIETFLLIGTVILFIALAVTPMLQGYSIKTTNKEVTYANYDIDRFNKYHSSEISDYEKSVSENHFDYGSVLNNMAAKKSPEVVTGGPMDSPWPMCFHDTHHTGRSPYSTADNPGTEKWRFDTIDECSGSPIIDDEGTIYIGSTSLYAVYPNGTLKWKYDTISHIESAPAIDVNGVIYVADGVGCCLCAIYSNNGTLKWKYHAGNWIDSSPAIGYDGSIYFGSEDDYIYALYPNGTLKWKYLTSIAVYAEPAIGDDGTVYCGSYDGNLYAFYPNNGTVKWFYHTGGWVGYGPSIADDGTIYFGSWDGYLYAVYPNGTLKWKTGGNFADTIPAIGADGTIYVGYHYLAAIYPNNGSVKWLFDPGPKRTIRGAGPCISAEGTIFFGTHIGQTDGGELIAVNPDGTERWRIMLATDWIWSAPAIGSDGTVYVGSVNDGYHPGSWGYLHAIGSGGPLEAYANGPYYGLINQPIQFTGSATGGYRPYTLLWDFGDGQTSNMQNPTHTYINPGNYTVTFTVTDDSDNTSSDATWAKIKESNNPPNKPSISGETNGETGTYYDYTFVSTDPDNDEYLNYYIDWGDGENRRIGPYAPGEDAVWGHAWGYRGTFTIRAKATDNYGGESDWETLSVTMPLDMQISQSNSQQINQQSSSQLLLKMMQRLLQNMK